MKKAKKEIIKRTGGAEDDTDWQSELSSWKSRRRKQSEETLMRVAEIKVHEDGGGIGERKM